MILVTETDIAIAIYEYLETTTACFVLCPSGKIDRNTPKKFVRPYLTASAPVLGRKKNWVIINENGDKVKFVKKGTMSHFKERYVDGCLYEYWIVDLESDFQSIHALLEWNDTTCCTVSCSGLTLSIKDLSNGP